MSVIYTRIDGLTQSVGGYRETASDDEADLKRDSGTAWTHL